MEGEGLYVACHNAKTDWILVKAICDWADGNKGRNKDANQKLAASNAARFVLHALQTIPLAGTGARAVGATGAHTSAGASGAQAQAFEHVPAHANALAHAHAQEPEVVLAFCDRSQVLFHLDDFLKAPAPSGKGLLCLVDHVDNCSPALMTRIHQELTGEDTSANGKRIRLLSFGSNNAAYTDASIFGKHLRPRDLGNDLALMQQVFDDRDDVLLCWHSECCSNWKAAQVQQYVQAAASWVHGLPPGPCKVVLVLVLRHHGQKQHTCYDSRKFRPCIPPYSTVNIEICPTKFEAASASFS